MIVICEECEKKYKIDASKIKGAIARFRCEGCGSIITIRKPTRVEDLETITPTLVFKEVKPAGPPKEERKSTEGETPEVHWMKLKRIGLRGKLMSFIIAPFILFFVIGAFFFLSQVVTLTDLITEESSKMVIRMAEKEMVRHARKAATEVRLYLLSHPELKKEGFSKNLDFKRIAVQEVGGTGYSSLYELPDLDGVWRTWADINPRITGIDMNTLKEPMGKAFAGFWKIFTGAKGGKESKGYYTWQDDDGNFRDKFMVCTPVEDTPYIIASTTYLDEFTLPVKRLERRSRKIEMKARINVGFMVGIILLIALIAVFYSWRLVGNIRYLCEVANRISVGELDAEIEVKTKDEIGELADAISRMQDSVRLSIERLRRRRA